MSNIRNNRIVKNIHISEEMKNNLLEACMSEKHSKLVTFVYSKQIVAAICALVIIMTGASVSAAVIGWRERLQAMSQEEQTEYIELANISKDGDSLDRDYTATELSRMQELIQEYHDGRYPESEITVVDTVAEIPAGTVCYVKEMGVIYFPAEEMTDEQLLQIIDYLEKTQYSLTGDLYDNPEDYQEGLEVDATEKAKQIGADAVMQYFGYDVSNDVRCSIYVYESSTEGESDSYWVTFESDELSSWVSNAFIYTDTWEVYYVSHSGWGKYYEDIPAAEVREQIEEYSAAAQEYVSKYFSNTGDIKSIRYKTDLSGEKETTECISFFLEYENLFIRIEESAYDKSIDGFILWQSKEEFDHMINSSIEFGYRIDTLE